MTRLRDCPYCGAPCTGRTCRAHRALAEQERAEREGNPAAELRALVAEHEPERAA